MGMGTRSRGIMVVLTWAPNPNLILVLNRYTGSRYTTKRAGAISGGVSSSFSGFSFFVFVFAPGKEKAARKWDSEIPPARRKGKDGTGKSIFYSFRGPGITTKLGGTNRL